MRIASPRLRRLDAALAGLGQDSDAMMLADLDGYVAGVILCPEPIAAEEWLPPVWNSDPDDPLFPDPLDARWFDAQVFDHRDAVAATLAKGAGRYRPFFQVDARNGDILWEYWAEGFAAALALRPAAWDALAAGDDRDAADALTTLTDLIAIARDESDADRAAIDALTNAAPDLIPQLVDRLHAHRPSAATPPPPTPARTAGRNDPCPCGSGRKHKKCCG